MRRQEFGLSLFWIPAFAGMTSISQFNEKLKPVQFDETKSILEIISFF